MHTSGLFVVVVDVFIGATDDEQWQSGLAHHGFSEAAHQQVHQTSAAVRAQHQQICAVLCR